MIIDILIVITIIVAIIIGRIRGFMKCLIGIASAALSIILALLFYRTVGDIIINNTEIDNSIKNTIVSNIGVGNVDINANKNLPKAYTEYVNKANSEINEVKNDIQDNIAFKIANEIIYALSYILIFLLIKVIAILLTFFSKIVEKLPVFKQINDIGGVIIGFLHGVLLVYITVSIISVISPLIKNKELTNQIEESHIGNYIYNNNILIKAIF